MAKLKRGIMYRVIHNRLKEHIRGNEAISRKELFCIFGQSFSIPKAKKYVVMKELVELKMIKFEKFGEIKIRG